MSNVLECFRQTGRTTLLYEEASKTAKHSPLEIVYLVVLDDKQRELVRSIKRNRVIILTAKEAIDTKKMTDTCIPIGNVNEIIYIDHSVIESILEVQLRILFQTTSSLNVNVCSKIF